MKKRIMVTLLVFMLLLTGCTKLVSIKTQNVEVVVVDSYHRSAMIQTMPVGKSVSTIVHPAQYSITVKYNDAEYIVSGSDTYNRFKDNIGQTVTGVLEIRSYDDGSVTYDIIELIGE